MFISFKSCILGGFSFFNLPTFLIIKFPKAKIGSWFGIERIFVLNFGSKLIQITNIIFGYKYPIFAVTKVNQFHITLDSGIDVVGEIRVDLRNIGQKQ